MTIPADPSLISRRVAYTGRNGNVRYGKIRDFATWGTRGNGMVDVALDNSTRPRFYVPLDTCVLVDDHGVPMAE